MALLSDDYRNEAIKVSKNMIYIDFSSNSPFMDEFTSALFLPHTNLNALPSKYIAAIFNLSFMQICLNYP
jgi:uncharacterized 2Fe-2S/4Fe-4S cluster protein (DUF4445 family)